MGHTEFSREWWISSSRVSIWFKLALDDVPLNIFAIFGLRAMYFLLLRSTMFTRRRRITVRKSRLKVI